ncbi:MAG: hypothetical protein KC668_10805 [Myxococcales bacterium]|nr:hypothetical protein [Myxococcales bacterium]
MTRTQSSTARAVSDMRPRIVAAALALLSVALLVAPATVSAQDALHCIDELDDAEVVRRTRALSERFRAHERHTRVFRIGWASLFAGFAIAEFAVIGPRVDGAQRWNAYISGVGAASAMLQMTALPMPGVWARRRIARMPDDTPEQRRERLRYALRALETAANSDRIIHGALSHATAIVWGLTWGTTLSVKFDNRFVAAQAYLGGMLVNELRILTAPSWATRAWTEARGGSCWGRYVAPQPSDPYAHEPELEVQLVPSMGGLGIQLTF